MSIRPGRAKGPWVGNVSGGSSAPDDATFVTVTDESAELANSSQLADVLLEGQAQQLNDKGASGVELQQRGSGFHDTFVDDPPASFWKGTEAIKSGDWTRSAGYLEGLAETNLFDTIRWRVEGDFDYALDVELNSATSGGFYLWRTFDTANWYRIEVHDGDIIASNDAGSLATAGLTGITRAWLRLVNRNSTLYWYYKLNKNDTWTLLHSLGTAFTSWDSANLALDSASTGRIYEIHLYDCMFPQGGYVSHPKAVDSPATSGAITLNVEEGNVIDLELTGNVSLTFPTGKPNQLLMLRVRQDATGGHTLSFTSGASFSSDLPSPTISSDPDAVDYLGFVYSEADSSWHYIAEVKGF